MKKIIFLLIVIVSCTPKGEEILGEYEKIEEGFHFYTIGDWGRNGQFKQKELADMMNKAGMKVEPEFIISTGDNFYHNGVASIYDPYWRTSFEEIYDGSQLFCDWYVVPGNHDYRGSVQAQIDYSNISRRWNMPDRYFFKDVVTDQGAKARFVFIDTSPLNDEYYEEVKYKAVHTQDTTKQLQWIDSVLNVEADWKIVIGHHPLYTGGKRADDKMWVRSHVEPLLEKHDVNAYFCGHEHDLQHIKAKKTHHIISGAGSEIRPTGMLPESKFAEAIQGFVSTTITKDSLYNQFLNYKGEVIYSFTIK